MNETTRINLNAIDAALRVACMSSDQSITSEQLDAAAETFYRVNTALNAAAALIEVKPTSDDPKHQACIDAAVAALERLDFGLCYDCGEFKPNTIERSQYKDDNILCQDCTEARAQDDVEWEREHSRNLHD